MMKGYTKVTCFGLLCIHMHTTWQLSRIAGCLDHPCRSRVLSPGVNPYAGSAKAVHCAVMRSPCLPMRLA